MPKINRSGQAAVLSSNEMQRLFRQIHHTEHKCIFALCRYTTERIGAVLKLQPLDVYDSKGKVRPIITFRGSTRKGYAGKPGKTRQVPTHPALAELLKTYKIEKNQKWLFPSPEDGNKHLSYQAVDQVLRGACNRAGLGDRGISTHSFRRTAITDLANSGVNIRVIQHITGHSKLDQLRTYIEVSEEQVKEAIKSL